MKSLPLLSAVACFVVTACGGSPPPEAKAPGEGAEPAHEHAHHEGKHEGGEKHHANLSPALQEFHGALAPVWHTAPGAERVTKACSANDALQSKATATGDAELISTTATLTQSCGAADKAEVEPSLEKVHHRFHELVEKH